MSVLLPLLAALVVAPLAGAQSSSDRVWLTFRSSGNATLGTESILIDLDGRGGSGEGTVSTVTQSGTGGGGSVRGALDALVLPEFKLASWQELGQYRITMSANDRTTPTTWSVDFDTGVVSVELAVMLSFRICGYPFKDCSVYTDTDPVDTVVRLSSAGEDGKNIDGFGFARLAGAVSLPAVAGHPLLNSYFGFPGASKFAFEIQLQFPDATPPGWKAMCRGGQSPLQAASPFYFESGVSKLGIGSGLPPFRFDPALGNTRPGGPGTLSAVPADGIATFVLPKEGVAIAPLEILPAIFNISLDFPVIAVNITLISDLTGTLNVCSGEMTMLFNATFTPVVGDTESTSLSVATLLTTETSTGFHNTVRGVRGNLRGDFKIVGVAKVPVTADPFVDFLLDLPNDAVTEMPSRFTIGCAGFTEVRQALGCRAEL